MLPVLCSDHIRVERSIVATGLSGDPGLGFGTGEPVACHQPLDLGFMVSVHRDDKIEVLVLAGLDQQRDNVNDHCCVACSPFQLGGSGPNGRVHDSLEIPTGDRVGEDDLGKPCPVELAVFEYLRPKTVQDRGKRRSARLYHLTGQYVGVNDGGTARGEFGGHHAFPDAMPPVRPTRTNFLLRARARSGSTDPVFLPRSHDAAKGSLDRSQ